MLQDIFPAQLKIEYENLPPQDECPLIVFVGECALVSFKNGEFFFPSVGDFSAYKSSMRYLFRLNDESFFLLNLDSLNAPDGYSLENMQSFRTAQPQYKAFAVVTAKHISSFYRCNTFCGCCGAQLKHSDCERAMICDTCGRTYYPQIAPSVIVALTDGDRILLTKYNSAHSSYKKYALIAGYCETGESAEQTVRREVMEEVGLRVKDITYYKSQPWGFTGTLLLGYFARLDGSDVVTMDEKELSKAEWFHRDEIPPTDLDISLTSEMIEHFRQKS